MAGNRLKKIGKGFGLLLLAVFLSAAVYLAAILLADLGEEDRQEWLVEEEQAPVTPMQAATDSDAGALAALFGADIPYLPGETPRGNARNTAHDGETVRMVTLQYPSGLEITAVRPASAAPLLLRGELSLSLRTDLSVFHLPASLTQKDGAFCLYFSDTDASYSVYLPNTTENAFLQTAERLLLAEP